MRKIAVAVITLGVALSSCSKATTPAGQTAAAPRSSPNLITRDEIMSTPVDNAYDAVQRLRPAFLRPKTIAGTAQNVNGSTVVHDYAVVYIDGIRKGGFEFLRSLPTREIAEVRYLNVTDATTRYGMNVPAGVIDVRLIGR